jgi:hypothetical protein
LTVLGDQYGVLGDQYGILRIQYGICFHVLE